MKSFFARRWAVAQLVVTAVLITLVVPAGLGAPDASAQTGGNQLVGIQGESRASGIYAFYNMGNVLPIASPVDSSAPDALTTISAGPSTFARAGVYDPGDLLASPDTLFQLGGFPGYEPGTVPSYPYRIQATSGFGEPEAQSNPAPGLRGRVEAQPDGSFAQAAAGESRAPGLVGFGGVTTTTTTETDGSTVTVTARTEITDFDLLDILTIDSIVTTVEATSDGTETVVSGGTEVGTAMLAGEEVTIDGEGIQTDEDEGDSGGLLGGALKSTSVQASELLSEAGITVTAGGLVEQDGGDAAQLAATGLQIELDITGDSAPVLGDLFGLFDQLPITPEVPGAPAQVADVLEIPRSRNITLLEVGRASVALAATSAPPVPEFTPPPLDTSAGGFTPSPTSNTGVSSTPNPTPAPTASPTTNGTGDEVAAPQPVASEPLAAFRGGLGALAVLILLAQPLFGAGLARMSRRILTPATGLGGVCPRGEPNV